MKPLFRIIILTTKKFNVTETKFKFYDNVDRNKIFKI